MVDQFDHLLGLNPSMRMKDKIHHPLLLHSDIKSHFQITNSVGVVRRVQVIGRPVAGDHARKFPARVLNHIRIRIVFDRVDETIMNLLAPF